MDAQIKDRIDNLVREHKVFLFMKGQKGEPQCTFSSVADAILQHIGAEYETFNVLEDPEIRQGIKDYSDWPTIPQLYINGEFVGGSDIMQELFESGELKTMIQ
ncbi:MAG: Grx4 family monothiol glutaredoxin [Candidatus Gracilibacteria bacterium]|mgnify:FL=1|nr:Grx4 family monothiol glutaredoxin [Candidatus Peregrinibacteria bacterium]